MKTASIALLALGVALSAYAHGGGLDKNGCHTNRKTGEYHCHGSSLQSAAPPPSSGYTRATAQSVTVQSRPSDRQQDLIRTAQVLLRALGYDATLFGTLDARTRSAITGFQTAENLPRDGAVTEYLVLRLAEKVATKCD